MSAIRAGSIIHIQPKTNLTLTQFLVRGIPEIEPIVLNNECWLSVIKDCIDQQYYVIFMFSDKPAAETWIPISSLETILSMKNSQSTLEAQVYSKPYFWLRFLQGILGSNKTI
jgi:hypothetical protein